jgi:hypothetical protein
MLTLKSKIERVSRAFGLRAHCGERIRQELVALAIHRLAALARIGP